MKNKGLLCLVLSCAVVGIATSLAYRTFQDKWISFRRARRLVGQGLYEKASQEYLNAVRKGVPKELVAGEILHFYRSTGSPGLLSRLKGFVYETKGTEAGSVLEMIADAEYSMGRYMESSRTYKLAAEADPGRKHLEIKRARSLFFAGRPEESVESYQLFFEEKEVKADGATPQ